MSVKIRLKRMGMKKKPFYRVVVADERSPRDGRFIEEIGYYDPMTEPATVKIDVESAKQWLKNGAQPTDTARVLLKKISDIEPFHPDRMASRILGMGDVMTLIEKAQEAFDGDEAEKLVKRGSRDQLTLEDFLSQMQQIGRAHV